MIFNSFEFIFLFLPIVWILYYVLGRIHIPFAKTWLLVASLFFYGYWNPAYLPLILISMLLNYAIGAFLGRDRGGVYRRGILTAGILFNVLLLGYYKYYDFFVENINVVFGEDLVLKNILLPLAISFYTFQQIAYLVDSYRLETKEYNFLNYGLFVSFFPQLIAGPIVHHRQVMSQFSSKDSYRIVYENISKGLLIFAIGLFKKVAIADQFAEWANQGYGNVGSLTFVDSWFTTLSYTLQLYFDFSGYSDMAIGLALLFNIRLPLNFNSPYKALDIQDFWRRWHITLSHFLTTYIYIPLGGNRKGSTRTYLHILIIFFISGIWHGAGWTFLIWGALHGFASVICRWWKGTGHRMNNVSAWIVTFLFVHLAWVFFRALTLADALTVLKAMFGFNGFYLPSGLASLLPSIDESWLLKLPFSASSIEVALTLAIGLALAFFAKNSVEIMEQKQRNAGMAVFIAVLLFYSVMQLQQVSEFLYFNF
ncbi:MBOAT family O-acyltransferase [Planococcus faecalis]|uniref:Membrane-bound O-acyltransferase family protein n=1 Tax=Planococcus faecalis TaxID=1598147 RepID=A0ABM6IUJ5_9BACL|nr:MBOAT family protein [Planococcus faecalis]AQU80242.1 membrane-bound O-acyltransferase family protein [Planococcus faecalis]OHX55129.1 acetyltransferase [Planococcus faecalis]